MIICFMYKHVGEKIRDIRRIKNISQQKLADVIGVTHQTYQYHEKTGNFDTHKLLKLAPVLACDFNTIFDLNSSEISDNKIIQTPEPPSIHIHYGSIAPEHVNPGDYEFIPLHDTKAAATPAVMDIADGQKNDYVCIPRTITHKHPYTEAFKVIGDSMSPVLEENDIVGVSIYKTAPDLKNYSRHSIYFCQIDDGYGIGYTLKKIQIMKNRYLLLIPINTSHDVMQIDLEEEKNYSPIVGRVVWMSRQF